VAVKTGKFPWDGKSLNSLNLNSEVETADDADKQDLGGKSGRMSLEPTPQTKPVYYP
jgi:hypothetical protein